MLPLNQKLVAELSMDESKLKEECILYGLDARKKENDESSSSDISQNDVDVLETKSLSHKKRVRFKPEGYLVHVREIPARSRSASSESEASASDSSSASDDSTYDESDSEQDSENEHFPREPQLPFQNTTATKATTMITEKSKPTVVRRARKPMPKQIETGVIGSEHLPPTTNSSSTPVLVNQITRPGARTRSARKSSETTQNDNNPFTNVKLRKHAQKSTVSQEKQLNSRQMSAKMASSQTSAKNVNNNTSDKIANGTERMSLQRRISSAKSNNRSEAKSGHIPSVSRTVTILRKPADAQKNIHNVRVTKALKSLSVGDLHTIDEFMFPTHQTSIVHFPQILINNVKQQQTFLSTPHKSEVQRQAVKDHNVKQNYDEHKKPRQTLTQPSNSNIRSYAWQMVNGSIPNSVQNTPSIAQLWDNE